VAARHAVRCRAGGRQGWARGREEACRSLKRLSLLPLSAGADPAPCPPSPRFPMASQPQPLRPALPCAAGGAGLEAGVPDKGLCRGGSEQGWGFAGLVCAGKAPLGCQAGARDLSWACCAPLAFPGERRGRGAPPARRFSSPRFSHRQRSPQAAGPAQTPGAAQAGGAHQALPAAACAGATAPPPGAALGREDEPPGRAPALQRGRLGGAPQAPLLHPQVARDPQREGAPVPSGCNH